MPHLVYDGCDEVLERTRRRDPHCMVVVPPGANGRLDLAGKQEETDASQVAVEALSGAAWQTLLDERHGDTSCFSRALARWSAARSKASR